MKKSKYISVCALFFAILLSGCSSASAANEAEPEITSSATMVEPSQTVTADENNTSIDSVSVSTQEIDFSSLISKRDASGEYDASEAITVSLSSGKCASPLVSFSDGLITISGDGVFLLSGSFEGQVLVNAGDEDKVQLVLSGADISCADSAAIYVLNADKVFVTLADGTKNSLSNGGTFVPTDDSNIDAVIFSKKDLTLNGFGALTINSPAGHGVVSKDDLVVTGGTYSVTALSHGLSGKDSISVSGGELSINCGEDAIHADSSDSGEAGFIYISGGNFDIEASDDALHADGAVYITGGIFDIPNCYEGIEGQSVTVDGGNFSIVSSDDGFNAAGGADGSSDWGGRQGQFAADENCFIIINGGSFTIVSDGDCIDSNGSITINGGTLYLTCNGNGNTAIDANGSFTNNGGSISTNDGSENMVGGQFGMAGSNRPDGFKGGMHGGNVTKGTMPDGEVPQGGMTDEDMPMGGMRGGNMKGGNMPTA